MKESRADGVTGQRILQSLFAGNLANNELRVTLLLPRLKIPSLRRRNRAI